MKFTGQLHNTSHKRSQCQEERFYDEYNKLTTQDIWALQLGGWTLDYWASTTIFRVLFFSVMCRSILRQIKWCVFMRLYL